MACVLRPVKTRPTPEHSQVCHAGLTAHLLSCKETLWCSNTACCGHTDEHVRVTATMLVSVVESHLWSCYSEGCSCCRGGRSWRDAVLGLSLSLSLSLSQSLLGNHHELAQLRSHQHHPLNNHREHSLEETLPHHRDWSAFKPATGQTQIYFWFRGRCWPLARITKHNSKILAGETAGKTKNSKQAAGVNTILNLEKKKTLQRNSTTKKKTGKRWDHLIGNKQKRFIIVSSALELNGEWCCATHAEKHQGCN